jgi:hypothetical protein
MDRGVLSAKGTAVNIIVSGAEVARSHGGSHLGQLGLLKLLLCVLFQNK